MLLKLEAAVKESGYPGTRYLPGCPYCAYPLATQTMRNTIFTVRVGLVIALLALPVYTFGQNTSPRGWLNPDWNKPPLTEANKKPAPKRSLAGTWAPADGPGAGTQAGG